MAQVTATAVDSSIVASGSSVPQSLIDAWSYTTTFAQAHARTVNSDPSSEQYFNAMTKELQELGWNVTEAGKLDYKQQAGKISPGPIVKSILDPLLDAQGQKEIAGTAHCRRRQLRSLLP